MKTAAENVLSRLEEGGTWDAHAEAHRLNELVRGIAAADLRAAGVPRAQLAAFETRASSVADLAARGVGEATAQVANQLLRVIAELYASLGDPVCGELLMLEHLEREIELRSRAGHVKAVDRAVAELRAAWRPMRERIIAVGAGDLAAEYDAQIQALERSDGPAAVRHQVPRGRALVASMDALLSCPKPRDG